MQKQFGKDTDEFKFFMEYWQLAQKYAEPEPDDSFWESAIKDFTELFEKYKTRIFFAKNLCTGYLNALSDKSREERTENLQS